MPGEYAKHHAWFAELPARPPEYLAAGSVAANRGALGEFLAGRLAALRHHPGDLALSGHPHGKRPRGTQGPLHADHVSPYKRHSKQVDNATVAHRARRRPRPWASDLLSRRFGETLQQGARRIGCALKRRDPRTHIPAPRSPPPRSSSTEFGRIGGEHAEIKTHQLRAGPGDVECRLPNRNLRTLVSARMSRAPGNPGPSDPPAAGIEGD